MLKKGRAKDVDIRRQTTLRQLGKEQSSMSIDGFSYNGKICYCKKAQRGFL